MSFTIPRSLVTPNYSGLTSDEANKKAIEFGKNILTVTKRKHWFSRVWGIVSEPMMLLLVATSIIYFFVGDIIQGFVIFVSIVPITIIEFLQEKRTDNAVEALNTLKVEECQVYRDAKVVKLAATELVPGDLVYLTAGDKVPADGLLIFTPGLLIDESILTGESVPVSKSVCAGDPEKAANDAKVFQGTMVTQGEAKAIVYATGRFTEYGKLGKLLEKIQIEETPLQKKIEGLVKKLALVAIAVSCAIGFALAARFGVAHGLLAALTVAISIIPEEFPIVFSVFLIMGVMRMTKRNAVVRQMALVESLGSATVICTDKTGTLTQGTLRLAKAWAQGTTFDIVSDADVIKCTSLVSDALLAVERIATDPIEFEVQRLSRMVSIEPEEVFTKHILRHDSSFNSETKMVHHSWEDTHGAVTQYIAGAPEAVIAKASIAKSDRERAEAAYKEFARLGYRVIGIGKKSLQKNEVTSNDGWELSGLLAMVDPPRAGVAESVAKAYDAGIRVCMITGDNELTALHLAELVGLKVTERPVSGDEIEKMPLAVRKAAVKACTIYYRVKPEQKFAIVEALQSNGEVVAMTGDGVNDAPALKKANIGVAMGERGTEVARAAAGMVLLDDNFSTIINAVEEGRRIYDNLRRAFVFLLSLHIPIVGMAVVPILFGQDLFFTPLLIIFLELFGDPAAVIGFERDKLRHGAMTSPPRPPSEPLVNPRLFGLVALYGGSIFALTLAVFFGLEHYFGQTEFPHTIAFVALVVAQISLVVFSREWQQVKNNLVLSSIAVITLSILTLIVFVPPLSAVFRFVPVSVPQYCLTFFGAALCMLMVSRIGKRIAKV